MNLKEKLKVDYILPEFVDIFEEGYSIYKDNSKIHKERKTEIIKENSKKYGMNAKKLSKIHLDFI